MAREEAFARKTRPGLVQKCSHLSGTRPHIFDSNGDGVGDFEGLAQKLDYLRDLGVNAIWLMPFFPSPLRDDGYDIADYTSVHPLYGSWMTLRNSSKPPMSGNFEYRSNGPQPYFRSTQLVSGIAELAGQSSPRLVRLERNRYTVPNHPNHLLDTEMSNWAWDPVSKSYYWHRFFSHQPDLNYDNPVVREEMWEVMKFWLDMGVDGFRLDAVPYLIEREGTNLRKSP